MTTPQTTPILYGFVRVLACGLLLLAFARWDTPGAYAQQIAIARIDMMPNQPTPYLMRDWKQVARGYDAFVFDLNRTGEYLPLIWRLTNTVNYPEHESFGLTTVVGTPRIDASEAINVLPALVGASLVGIDKGHQNGEDWVLMAEEYFNRRPEENVYLNLPVTRSGDDWWYETMPNVFFYQLYDLYSGTGDFDYQFRTVADQWLRAVEAMGGSTTPWAVPSMNYRAWSLATMTPLRSGVPEPEAAGAIAWLLYHAYVETGEERYRIGAEWAMDFLNARPSNPAYELQLAYGVYTAARTNAELGTGYDLEKMINWCFNVGPLRSWGAIVGRWGGYDVSGLIGEVSSNDYAFLLNGYEQAGALVPMTRYDDRFSRAIGKWVLNLANASRLFYPNYLPALNQDSETWSFQYDPDSYIGHEALRREQAGHSPYATGDAVAGGWGFTNLTLYGASHVGILGGLIDTTDVPMILRLDLLKTDYFHPAAYPTYLYFNPYDEDQTVTVDAGSGLHNLYDAVTNRFIATGVSGLTPLSLPADAAVQLVVTPAGGTVTYDLDRMLVDGIVVDYRAGRAIANHPPRIRSLAAAQQPVSGGEATTLYCTAQDRDGHLLTYRWSAPTGIIEGSGSAVTWTAPTAPGVYPLTCTVDDGQGGTTEAIISVAVIDNLAPVIDGLAADPAILDAGGVTTLTCTAHDPNGDPLTYVWNAAYGTLAGDGPSVGWTAPAENGYYEITCVVRDPGGAEIQQTTGVVVGHLVGHYPFDGDARDQSGFDNHGAVDGATLTDDLLGGSGNAYAFDGVDDVIRIPVHPSLNVRDALSLSFRMKTSASLAREAFVISHGSWQNRWKVSITAEQRLRWTAKTETGVFDLDSGTLTTGSLYTVTVTYGDGSARIYLNGVLEAEKNWTGALLQTPFDLTVGQMLPGNNQWNFEGCLDDIRIYNTVLSEADIRDLYDLNTGVEDANNSDRPTATTLYPNYPNPFRAHTVLRYDLDQAGPVEVLVFNLLGQKVRTLYSGTQLPGRKQVTWDGRDEGGHPVAASIYIVQLRAGDHRLHRKLLRL